MFLAHLLSRLAVNILALWLAAQWINGIDYHNNWRVLVVAGSVLGLLNMFIKPILKVITAPCLWLILGLFFPFVVNLIILYLTAWLVPGFAVATFWAALLATLVISILNFILSLIFIKRK